MHVFWDVPPLSPGAVQLRRVIRLKPRQHWDIMSREDMTAQPSPATRGKINNLNFITNTLISQVNNSCSTAASVDGRDALPSSLRCSWNWEMLPSSVYIEVLCTLRAVHKPWIQTVLRCHSDSIKYILNMCLMCFWSHWPICREIIREFSWCLKHAISKRNDTFYLYLQSLWCDAGF